MRAGSVQQQAGVADVLPTVGLLAPLVLDYDAVILVSFLGGEIAEAVASHVNLIADTLSTETEVSNLQSFIDLLVQMGELQKTVSAKELLAPTP